MAGTIVSNWLTLVGATWIGVEENLLTIAVVERSTEQLIARRKLKWLWRAFIKGASADGHVSDP